MRNKGFPIQTDEATDCSGIVHLIDYVQYIKGKTVNEYMILCRPMKRRATEKNSSKLLMIS
jgi:hypothetical protein